MNIKFVDLDAIDWTEERVARFWSYVDKQPSEGCWEWTKGKCGGYGRFYLKQDGKVVGIMAHRLSMHLHGIGLPSDMVCDHVCRNRKCVRPDHIRVVTCMENIFAEGSLAITKALSERVKCDRGHDFEPEWGASAGRRCRICHKEAKARRLAARRGGGA